MKTQRSFRLVSRGTGGALLVVVGLGGTGTPASAFECPAPHPIATTSAIKQTEPEIVRYSKLLGKQGIRVVPEIIARLKKTHPGVGDPDITNFLVTIYCPVVNRNADLGDDQKREKITAFSANVTKRLERP
jgi:hypothetical protein